MKSVPNLRLPFHLSLLCALSASVLVVDLPALGRIAENIAENHEIKVTAVGSGRGLSAVPTNVLPAVAQITSPAILGSLAAIRENPVLATALVINIVLFVIILFLLQRNELYRQTVFAKAFRSSPLGTTISTRAEGRYVDANDAFLQMFNYERRNVIGRTAADLNLWVEPEERSRMLQQLGDSSVSKSLSTRFRMKSGEIRDVNVSAELIELDGVPCVLAVTQDVTEAKRLENQLRQAHRMGAVGRMAGGIAHDFNNILTVIMGYSELVLHRLGSTHPVSKNLVEVKRAAERAATLTRQLLAFSRQQVLYPRVLDLNALVNNLNQMLHRLIGEDIVLSFQPGNSLSFIKADVGQMEQIMMNLVVNARDAMPKGGRIAISTSNVELGEAYLDSHFSVRPGRYVLLSITDNGCGMDDRTLSHIFEPFFTTKGPGHGTGLGLSTVYGIVKQSDGYIWVYSELGKGTTFKLYFPQYEEGVPLPVEPGAEDQAVGGTETILVVEDDAALRKLTVVLLESTGYRVLEADNGETAIRVIEDSAESIDLLLTDVLMPAMSGVELSAYLRKSQPGLKILLMSGYPGDLIAKHREGDADIALIEKPFTRHGLLAKIRAVLKS